MILSTVVWVLTALMIIGLIVYLVGVYNSRVALDRSVSQIFGNLESVMKQRHDEIPKLVNACRAYMEHEKGLLEEVTRLRSGFDQAPGLDQKVLVENKINRRMRTLSIAWEAYPDLKASNQFLQIHDRMSGLEAIINDRREQFNEAVTSHNIFIARFPALLVAWLFGWLEKNLLEVAEADKTDNLAPFPLAGR